MRILYPITAFLLFSSFSLFGQTQKPDREIDGYKGAIRRVVTERADLKRIKGKDVELNRRYEQDIEYDRTGNRYRELSYDYASGLLREIAVYKRIDGNKVVAYQHGPGAIVAEVPPKAGMKKFDPRYDFKFKYKHDQLGNILEEAWWHSDGEPWLRYVYSYDRKSKQELVFDEKGDLNQKYVYKLDDKNNVIEEVIYDTDNDSPTEKIIYTYLAFDAEGNWTKRSETSGDKEGNFAQKPREVTYRKLVYY